MKYNHNFDVDAALRNLETISRTYQQGSPEEESLRAAAAALVYVREVGRLEDYREFFRMITTPAIEGIKVSHTFMTRQEAEQWLKDAGAPDGELVRIAGEGFQVVNLPGGPRFLRTPLPEELE